MDSSQEPESWNVWATTSIEWHKIIAHKGKDYAAFEELVCQGLRRTETAGNDSWWRFEGGGGDGGVEAIWHQAEGEKVGLQAKYFTKSGDIKWDEIKKSFFP